MNAFIRLLYSLLIAGAVVAFIGVGVNTAYQSPKFPEYTFKPFNPNASQEEMNKEQEENDRQWREYDAKQKDHNRNVTYILLPAAALVTVAGVVLMRRKSDVVGEGVSLGGIATSVYAVFTASIANHELLRFGAVTLLLVSAVLLAHKRFMDPVSVKVKASKKKR